MICYTASPMRGIPHFSFPQLDAARDALTDMGHEVISPADLDRAAGFDAMELPEDYDWDSPPDKFDLQDCIRRDIEAVLDADAIVLLPGWRASTGVQAELAVAKWAGKKVYEWVENRLRYSEENV